MRSKGLGDSIAKITQATGIKTVVDKVAEGLNIPCGCSARQNKLNEMFPYNNKPSSSLISEKIKNKLNGF